MIITTVTMIIDVTKATLEFTISTEQNGIERDRMSSIETEIHLDQYPYQLMAMLLQFQLMS